MSDQQGTQDPQLLLGQLLFGKQMTYCLSGVARLGVADHMKLDSTWIAERYLSEAGGYAEKEAELFVNGALKAGLPACVPADKLTDMGSVKGRPNSTMSAPAFGSASSTFSEVSGSGSPAIT